MLVIIERNFTYFFFFEEPTIANPSGSHTMKDGDTKKTSEIIIFY